MTVLLVNEAQEQDPPIFQIPDNCKTLLIGEGKNDARFLAALARRIGNPNAYGYDIGGSDEGKIDALNSTLKSAVSAGGFLRLRSFALVLDADMNGTKALKKINNCMKTCFAEENFAHGEVRALKVRGEDILAGVFVMPGFGPGGQIKGALETLVLKAAEQTNREEMECVETFRKCAQNISGKHGQRKHEPKKKAQALLSALPENSPYLGAAAQDGHIDFSASAYDALKKFLQKLSP